MRWVRRLLLLLGAAVAVLALLVAVDVGGPSPVIAATDAPIRAELHRRIPLGAAPARQLAFSPDGSLLAASSADGSIRLWRVAERGPPRILVHEGGATSLAFSGDGRLLASGGYDGQVRLWRVADGRPMRALSGARGTIWSVDVSPDGERIASGGEDRIVRLWRFRDGALIKAMPGHALNIWSIRFSPDGRTLASSSFDRGIRLWDGLTGAPLRRLAGHEQAVVGLDISPNGFLLASGGDDSTVRLWRMEDGAPLKVLRGSSHVYAVAFSPEGLRLAGGGRAHGALRTLWHQATGLGGGGPAIRLWNVRTGEALQTLDSPDDVMSVTFSPDGHWLAAGSEDGAMTIWTLRKGEARAAY
jgi:WD40 repeat protein